MGIYEFAIAARDEEDLASGHKRKKQGDIIACKPYPWEWGEVEKKKYLFVIIDGLDKNQANALCSPHYPQDKLQDELQLSRPIPLAKRRFSIPLDNLSSVSAIEIDTKELEDYTKEYQPMKKRTILYDEDDIIFDKEKGKFSKEKINGKLKKITN